jgi:Rps23 Pro-64 3,4-dihydroxylase Tpa1-like proline 4-hydroxylase
MLNPLNREVVRQSYLSAKPFSFFAIENFLTDASAREIAACYPSFDNALEQGRSFNSVNERKKVQITDSNLFPPAVAKLNSELSSKAFLDDLSYITGIQNLIADAELVGGGIHVTGPGGRLDVHVDFNYMEERKLHRRLNLLLYLNPKWEENWGGHIQLWDKDIKRCEASFAPALNRCVVFETTDTSYHGVTPVSPNAPVPRQSFAAYYYTREAPAHWTGETHSTLFKARPEERFRKYVAMPAEKLRSKVLGSVKRAKRGVRNIFK